MLAVIVSSALLVLWIITLIHRNNKSGLKDMPNAHFSVPIHDCGCCRSDGEKWKIEAELISIVTSVQSFGSDPVM